MQRWRARDSPWGGLGTVIQTVFSFEFFFYGECVLADQFPPSSRVASISALLIAPKGAESPGSGRIGMMGALVFFFPSEAVQHKLHSPWPAQ